MDGKKIALLVGALVVAAITAVVAKNLFAGASTPQAVAATVPVGPEVLVATQTMPVGTIIDPASLRYQPWPKDLIEKAYYIRGQGAEPTKLAGSVVRYAITAGQPITQGALVQPGDRGFLAAALGPGMRAVTVSVSTQSGVGGFVFPGDRVDLVLTQEVTGGGDGPALKASETIIRNMRVLATDQRTSGDNEEGKTDVRTFSTVTLEATPKIAEKIAVAQTIGQLSLSLRSIADNTAELEREIAAGEINVPEGQDPKAEKKMLLAAASLPVDNNTTFTVGADVSRFQRRTVPAKPSQGQMAPVSMPTVAASPTVVMGPVVRIARGNSVTAVPVGGK